MEIVIHDVKPLLQSLQCVRIAEGIFREGSVPMRDQTLEKQILLWENRIAASLLEGARRQKNQFCTAFTAGTSGTDQFLGRNR